MSRLLDADRIQVQCTDLERQLSRTEVYLKVAADGSLQDAPRMIDMAQNQVQIMQRIVAFMKDILAQEADV